MIIISTSLLGCSNKFGYVEGETYSESVLSDYNNKSQNDNIGQYISREEAISKALNIFEEGFKVDINRSELDETINLSKWDSEIFWNISWNKGISEETDEEYLEFYTRINSITGEVAEARVIRAGGENDMTVDYYNEEFIDVNAEEVTENLAKVLGIEINDFNIVTKPNYDVISVNLVNNDGGLVHQFMVSGHDNSLVSYLKKDFK